MGVKLSFFTGGGADGIGGNKLLLEADGTALFLDFGKSFGQEKKYFDEYLKPRGLNGLGDLFAFDLIPPIQGIYRHDLELHRNDWWNRLVHHPGYRELEVQGVLLSHAHLDHSGYLSLLSPDIPIYTSLSSALIAKVIQDTGVSDFLADTVYARPREMTAEGWLASEKSYQIPAEQRSYHVFTEQELSQEVEEFWDKLYGKRPLISQPLTLHYNSHSQAGNLPLHFWPVDHSIPGAGAFGIETPQGWVIYTGDIRRHGIQVEQTRRFIKEATSLRPLLLIIEGTRAQAGEDDSTKSRRFTEHDVAGRIEAIVHGAQDLVVADFGARNVERLWAILQAATSSGRILVITTKDAYLLETLSHGAESYLPHPLGDPRIRVFSEARATYSSWERDLLDRYAAQCVNYQEISLSPGKWILCFSYYDLSELIDIDPVGGTYIYSATEAFNEEMELDAAKLLNWIDRFGFTLFGNPLARERHDPQDPLHVGGHAQPEELLDMIESIRPEYLLPVHTEGFEFFERHFGHRRDIRLIRPVVGGSWEV